VADFWKWSQETVSRNDTDFDNSVAPEKGMGLREYTLSIQKQEAN
jgi:hypothetical protein